MDRLRTPVGNEESLVRRDRSRLNVRFTLPVLVGNQNGHESAFSRPKATVEEQRRWVATQRERPKFVDRLGSHEPSRFVEDGYRLTRRKVDQPCGIHSDIDHASQRIATGSGSRVAKQRLPLA